MSDLEQFLSACPPATHDDCRQLALMMQEISAAPPKLWGSMLGFGDYHYRYASGREGDIFQIGFALRKSGLVVYLNCHHTLQLDDLLTRLGKHSMGKSCLYIKKLADVDQAVLREIVRMAHSAVSQA
ncbi:DUF1801 domain-containing protein [Massilia sp. W12]|uniref:DUF1801 domain-containing protein n=1 Tax=Massilia sp. W12 TaxID=3126507 RepID=UPI0030D361C4